MLYKGLGSFEYSQLSARGFFFFFVIIFKNNRNAKSAFAALPLPPSFPGQFLGDFKDRKVKRGSESQTLSF